MFGTFTATPASGGQAIYTLTCTTGQGVSISASAALVTPIPVLKSSYENKMAAGAAIGPQPYPAGASGAIAFADFFQDGTFSMITHTKGSNISNPPAANDYGSIHFWKFVEGAWIDNTNQLLTETVGCLNPTKAIVADFNGDGVPDVFFACAGAGAGEQPHLILSQLDHTYKNIPTSVPCACYSAAAADQAGNGYANVVVVDSGIQNQPYFLVNNKDGTFTPDYLNVPPATLAVPLGGPGIPKSIYTVEFIDFNHTGRYDLFFAGDNNGTLPAFFPSIFYNPGNYDFSSVLPSVLPYSYQANDGVTLDIVFVNGNIYLLRTDGNTEVSIEKINGTTFASSTIYTHAGDYSTGSILVDWIIAYQGHIVSLDNEYGLSVSE